MVAETGLEPAQSDNESDKLPLLHSAKYIVLLVHHKDFTHPKKF